MRGAPAGEGTWNFARVPALEQPADRTADPARRNGADSSKNSHHAYPIGLAQHTRDPSSQLCECVASAPRSWCRCSPDDAGWQRKNPTDHFIGGYVVLPLLDLVWGWRHCVEHLGRLAECHLLGPRVWSTSWACSNTSAPPTGTLRFSASQPGPKPEGRVAPSHGAVVPDLPGGSMLPAASLTWELTIHINRGSGGAIPTGVSPSDAVTINLLQLHPTDRVSNARAADVPLSSTTVCGCVEAPVGGRSLAACAAARVLGGPVSVAAAGLAARVAKTTQCLSKRMSRKAPAAALPPCSLSAGGSLRADPTVFKQREQLTGTRSCGVRSTRTGRPLVLASFAMSGCAQKACAPLTPLAAGVAVLALGVAPIFVGAAPKFTVNVGFSRPPRTGLSGMHVAAGGASTSLNEDSRTSSLLSRTSDWPTMHTPGLTCHGTAAGLCHGVPASHACVHPPPPPPHHTTPHHHTTHTRARARMQRGGCTSWMVRLLAHTYRRAAGPALFQRPVAAQVTKHFAPTVRRGLDEAQHLAPCLHKRSSAHRTHGVHFSASIPGLLQQPVKRHHHCAVVVQWVRSCAGHAARLGRHGQPEPHDPMRINIWRPAFEGQERIRAGQWNPDRLSDA